MVFFNVLRWLYKGFNSRLTLTKHKLWMFVYVVRYRPPGSTSEEFQLFREQLDYLRTHHRGKNLPSVHVLGDFKFKDIDWPDRLSNSGSRLSQSEGQILIDIMNNHGLEQMVHFPKRTHWTRFSPPYLASFKIPTPLTNLVIMTLSQEPWKFSSPQ